MFENKTQSEILKKLDVPESILKFKYMTGSGKGLDLLQALHEHISPEEMIKHRKAFGFTENQIKKLLGWLEVNCVMVDFKQKFNIGYGYCSRAIFDNCEWGVLTKIRRHIMDWEPKVSKDGHVYYEKFDWINDPEIYYKSKEVIILTRKSEHVWRNDSGCDIENTYFGNIYHCFVKTNGEWKKVFQTNPKVKDVFDAMELMNKLAS